MTVPGSPTCELGVNRGPARAIMNITNTCSGGRRIGPAEKLRTHKSLSTALRIFA